MYYETYEAIRNEKGLKDSDVCRMTGIKSPTMTDWKKGRYTPKMDKLQKIADALDVSLDRILTGQDVEKESVEGMKYYFSDETAELAQAMYEDDELRLLADGLRKVSKEDLAAVIAMVEVMKRKESKE